MLIPLHKIMFCLRSHVPKGAPRHWSQSCRCRAKISTRKHASFVSTFLLTVIATSSPLHHSITKTTWDQLSNY